MLTLALHYKYCSINTDNVTLSFLKTRRAMKQTTFGLKNSSTSKTLTKTSFLESTKGLKFSLSE